MESVNQLIVTRMKGLKQLNKLMEAEMRERNEKWRLKMKAKRRVLVVIPMGEKLINEEDILYDR